MSAYKVYNADISGCLGEVKAARWDQILSQTGVVITSSYSYTVARERAALSPQWLWWCGQQLICRHIQYSRYGALYQSAFHYCNKYLR
jgi:hypothetical protein